ncbi:unnamed protein product [Lathyrus sativus]|nr:unnamed protein product [Lathyrus sativus]
MEGGIGSKYDNVEGGVGNENDNVEGNEDDNVEGGIGKKDDNVDGKEHDNVDEGNDSLSEGDEEYVESEGENDSSSEGEDDYVTSKDDTDSINVDWTLVIQGSEDVCQVAKKECDYDSDQLHTSPDNGDDEKKIEKFPSFRSGEGLQFQLDILFNNKELVREAVKDYLMDMKKNQVVSLIDEHRCCRTPKNRQAKPGWLAKRFTNILRYNPNMKPVGLIDESFDRWGVKLSHDQAYRAKRRAMDMIQGAGIDQFSHLRSYAEELLKSNPNSTILVQCVDSKE